MFIGQSGRKYLVERVLQAKERPSRQVLLARYAGAIYPTLWTDIISNGDGGEKFVLKEIHPENYDTRLNLYQRAGTSPYLRGLNDTIPEHSIFVHSYLNDNFLTMVQMCLPIAIIKRILKDALRGLAALHEKDIAHFDIKANNIMVDWKDNNGKMDIQRVQLVDLEDSAYLPHGHAAKGMQLGNLMWRSPEAHAEGPIEKPADIFSFGIVCLYAVLRRVVFAVGEEETADGTDEFVIVLERQISYFAEAETLDGLFQYLGPNPFYPLFEDIIKDFSEANPRQPFRSWRFDETISGFDDNFKDFVGQMTNFDPRKRLTAKEALKHVWFAGVD